jgi:hypothetical protein
MVSFYLEGEPVTPFGFILGSLELLSNDLKLFFPINYLIHTLALPIHLS